MPLIKSGSREAVGRNIAEMEAAGHPAQQAIAASLRNARKYGAHFASGGAASFGERMAARSLTQGYLHGNGPGRVDHLPITVKGGAYVVPADHLAAIGQGNSQAGASILGKMFNMIPGGGGSIGNGRPMKAQMPHLNLKPPKMADGGSEDGDADIIAANGEFVVPPEKLIERFGDLDHAHKAMDQWIVETRKKHVETLRKLKPPRRD